MTQQPVPWNECKNASRIEHGHQRAMTAIMASKPFTPGSDGGHATDSTLIGTLRIDTDRRTDHVLATWQVLRWRRFALHEDGRRSTLQARIDSEGARPIGRTPGRIRRRHGNAFSSRGT